MTTIAWTGHRPKDMPGTTYMEFRSAMDAVGLGARKDVAFITGGALGADTWAAEYALTNHLPYTIILPFPVVTMTEFWTAIQRHVLEIHIEHASDVQIVHDELTYDVRAYQRRNEEMVNRADYVFAVWTGKQIGGTANCIRYALKMGKPVFNTLPLTGRLHRITAT